MKYDDEKEKNWESSELGDAINGLIEQLQTLQISGNTKTKVDWIIDRLNYINHISYNIWYELQEEKAKPKWVKTILET